MKTSLSVVYKNDLFSAVVDLQCRVYSGSWCLYAVWTCGRAREEHSYALSLMHTTLAFLYTEPVQSAHAQIVLYLTKKKNIKFLCQ